MALSANASYEMRDTERISTIEMKVLTAAVLYNGSLCSHDTTVGAIKPYDGTSADKLVGWHFGDSVTGLTTASVPPTGTIKVGGFVLVGLTVAGLSAGVVDSNLGAIVWATDDGTYTITDPSSTGHEIGHVVKYNTSAIADVLTDNVYGLIDS